MSNAALTSLLYFFKYFIGVVGNAFQRFQLQAFSEQVPQTLCGAMSRVGIAANQFIEYVVFPSCHSIYEYEDCVATVGGEKVSNNCCHVSYPNHPHRSRRQKCGVVLLKKVKTGRGHRFVPIKECSLTSLCTNQCNVLLLGQDF